MCSTPRSPPRVHLRRHGSRLLSPAEVSLPDCLRVISITNTDPHARAAVWGSSRLFVLSIHTAIFPWPSVLVLSPLFLLFLSRRACLLPSKLLVNTLKSLSLALCAVVPIGTRRDETVFVALPSCSALSGSFVPGDDPLGTSSRPSFALVFLFVVVFAASTVTHREFLVLMVALMLLMTVVY